MIYAVILKIITVFKNILHTIGVLLLLYHITF